MIVNVHIISGQFFPIGRTYHVITFFFTAGLVHGCTERWKQKSLVSFAKSRLRQLGHPYCILSLCYILMHMAINMIRGDSLINIVIKDSFLKTITFRGIGTLWFFPVLFIGEIVFYAAKRKNIQSSIIVLVGVLVVVITSYLNKYKAFNSLDNIKLSTIALSSPLKIIISSLIASGFIALGHWLYRHVNILFQDSFFASSKKLICLFAVCIISFIVDYSLIGLYYGELHKLDIIDPVVYIVCSLAGLTFVTSLALIIKRTSKLLSSLMIYLGENSLIIMTTHTEYYINSIANLIIVSAISVFGITVSSKIISGIALIIIMLFEVGIVFIVNHSILKKIFIAKKY